MAPLVHSKFHFLLYFSCQKSLNIESHQYIHCFYISHRTFLLGILSPPVITSYIGRYWLCSQHSRCVIVLRLINSFTTSQTVRRRRRRFHNHSVGCPVRVARSISAIIAGLSHLSQITMAEKKKTIKSINLSVIMYSGAVLCTVRAIRFVRQNKWARNWKVYRVAVVRKKSQLLIGKLREKKRSNRMSICVCMCAPYHVNKLRNQLKVSFHQQPRVGMKFALCD